MPAKPRRVWRGRRRRALVVLADAINTVFGTDATETALAAKYSVPPVLFETGDTDPVAIAMNLLLTKVSFNLALTA